MRGAEASGFHKVAGDGLSIVPVGWLHSMVDTLAVDSWAWLQLRDESSSSYMLTQAACSCVLLFDETML